MGRIIMPCNAVSPRVTGDLRESFGSRGAELYWKNATGIYIETGIISLYKTPETHSRLLSSIYIYRVLRIANMYDWIIATAASRITYLLTPWSRVLPEKLTGLQLVKKFPAFYRTRRFITALTSARHLSLS
jgi:hypothetical protein